MQLKPGTRLRSAADATEIIVVRAPAGDVDLRCGGHAVLPLETPSPHHDLDPSHAEGTQVGKRYADPDSGLEVLCTKAGDGSLALGGTRLALTNAKPLPSSD